MQVVILLGPPGSGKDTQAKKFAEAGYTVLPMSQILTERADLCDDNVSREIRQCMKKGDMVSPEITDPLVAAFLEKQQHAGVQTVVINGYPRNLKQAHFLDEFLAQKHIWTKAIELE